MGSTSSAIASPYAGTYFNGLSSYSQDLNNAIGREVAIASLPIQELQNTVSSLTGQQTELNTLNRDITAVQSAISSLSSAAGNMLAASVSDPSVATASLDSTATAGSYTLEVDNLGSYSDALSTSGLQTVTDPTSQNISSSTSYTLSINGQAIQPPISPTDTSLNGLAAAINNANAGVQATVVNIGSTSSPDYRLSLQSSQYGDYTIQLNDGTQNLLATSTTGAPVQYMVDGQSISSGSRTAILAPGVTVNLTGTNVGDPATVTVAQGTQGISSALQSFVSAFNTAMSELAYNRGQGGGPLTGQSIVTQLATTLQNLTNYNSGLSQIPSLAALGVSFSDTTGQLSFDAGAFNSATSGQSDALASFLGSATGGGFLQTATNTLSSMVDPTAGYLTEDITSVQSQLTSMNTQISNKVNQINLLQQNLTTQMAQADAMIYQMQQQATYFQQMFLTQTANNTAGLL
jgi:flagellar hook-associated protein 2